METTKSKSGFMKGAALVSAMWVCFTLGHVPGSQAQAAAAPKPAPAVTHAAKAHKAHKPAQRHARPVGVRVSCGAYDLTFAPHDKASADDAAKAAASFIMSNEGCAK